MKKQTLLILGLFLILPVLQMQAQKKAWVVPARFNPDDTITLYVDVSQTDCQRLKSTTDDVYLWIWQPADPIIGNGTWGNSNDDLKMTRDSTNPDVYYFKLVCTDFFVGIDANPSLIYKNNFNFLAKKKDGTGLGGGGCDEDKTEDLSVEAKPLPGCNTLFCKSPQTFMQDDYFTFIYNNAEEPKQSMWEANVGVDNFYVYCRANLASGGIREYVAWGDVGNTPELNLIKDPNDGLYKITFVPEDFFKLKSGEIIKSLEFVVRNKVFTTPADKTDQKNTVFVGCN
jgi:hypothetical protein